MTLTDQAKQRPAEHWGELAAYFSMDLTEPYWPALGFRTSRPLSEPRDVLRRMIEALRQDAARTPDALPDIREWLFSGTRLDWHEDELRSFLDLGLAYETVHSEVPHISGWQIALMYFPDMFEKSFALMARDDAALEGFMTLRDTRLRLDPPPKLSDWDVQLCARHGWNPAPFEIFPPLDSLSLAHAFRVTDQVLRYAAERFDRDAQTALWHDAQAILTEFEVHMPGPLEPLHLKVS